MVDVEKGRKRCVRGMDEGCKGWTRGWKSVGRGVLVVEEGLKGCGRGVEDRIEKGWKRCGRGV